MTEERFLRWQSNLTDFSLPRWEELPELELYMDQVVLLVGGYLSKIPASPDSDKIITASIVNNYVRMKIMPPPVKKKYSRVHLAYLIVICTMKQSMSIATIQHILPPSLSEEEVKATYQRFVEQNAKAGQAFLHYLQSYLPSDFTIDDLPVAAVSVAGLAKSLTEYLLYQEQPETGEVSSKKHKKSE